MTLLTDLDAFTHEHERGGELDGGVEGELVWMTRPCGAKFVRPIFSQTWSTLF
jgi:hypothetical protein